MKFKAIVFDMDGVLVDSERFHSKVLDNFFVESGIDASHLTPKDFVGSVLKDMWPKVLRDKFTEAHAAQVHQEFLDYDAQFPIPYKELLLPGVTDALKTFSEKGYKMAVASSSRRHEIAEVLDTHDLRQYFEFFLSGQDEFEQSKPNPAIYLAAMEKLGVEPSETLIIEDSHYGIMAGKAAGATVWAVKDNYFGINQEQADRFIETLTDAKNLLAESE